MCDGLPCAEGESVQSQCVAVVPLVPGAQRAVQAAVRVRAASDPLRDAVVHGVVDKHSEPQPVFQLDALRFQAPSRLSLVLHAAHRLALCPRGPSRLNLVLHEAHRLALCPRGHNRSPNCDKYNECE